MSRQFFGVVKAIKELWFLKGEEGTVKLYYRNGR